MENHYSPSAQYERLLRQKKELSEKSRQRSNIHGLEGQHNGAADAFRHAFTSALTTQSSGEFQAKVLGFGNELINDIQTRKKALQRDDQPYDERVHILIEGNPTSEWEMDEHNNKIGRDIGRKARMLNWSEEQIEEEVLRQLKEGKLFMLPSQKEKDYY